MAGARSTAEEITLPGASKGIQIGYKYADVVPPELEVGWRGKKL